MSAVPKNLRAFAGMLESINEAIVVLDRVETLAQFEAENKQAVERLRAEAAAARDEASAARAEVEARKVEAAGLIELAKQDAETIKADAVAEAERVTAEAQEAAAKTKAKENASEAAERKAKAGLKEAEEKTAACARAFAEIEQKIEDAKAAARAKFGI
jgi:hypothetical protein